MHDGGSGPRGRGQLDPLLRELLDFGLVELDSVDGTWRLSDAARHRLTELAVPHPPADKIVYFGHRCRVCEQVKPTRLHVQGYLCDECNGKDTAQTWEPSSAEAAQGLSA